MKAKRGTKGTSASQKAGAKGKPAVAKKTSNLTSKKSTGSRNASEAKSKQSSRSDPREATFGESPSIDGMMNPLAQLQKHNEELSRDVK